MNDCIFCQIAKKEIPAKIQYEDKDMIAFDDIHPKAPVHILIVPKKHIASVNEVQDSDVELIGRTIVVAKELAKKKGVDKTGYRLIFNTGPHSGQIVDHLHLHLIGGQNLGGMI